MKKASTKKTAATTRKCSDVMTRDPVCCVTQDPASDVAEMMKNENVGSIPVVDTQENRKLVGIVTDRDLALRVVAAARDAHATRAEDIMSDNPLWCHEDDELDRCLELMERQQLRRIPILDGDHRVVGIVAQADIATRVGEPETTAELVEDVSR